MKNIVVENIRIKVYYLFNINLAVLHRQDSSRPRGPTPVFIPYNYSCVIRNEQKSAWAENDSTIEQLEKS